MKTDPFHPQHEMISKTVRDWFHQPFEGSGYRAVRRPWGTYWDNSLVYPSQLQADGVEEFLADPTA
jgi:hypothetical protein